MQLWVSEASVPQMRMTAAEAWRAEGGRPGLAVGDPRLMVGGFFQVQMVSSLGHQSRPHRYRSELWLVVMKFVCLEKQTLKDSFCANEHSH